MKIIVIHRDPPPTKISPSTGAGIRLEQISMALQNAGYETFLCQYEPHRTEGNFISTPEQLISYIREIQPIILIFIQPEDVFVCHQIQDVYESLSVKMPYIIVDLYAQRLLEASLSAQLDRDIPYIFEALRWGDCFLTSNDRQRWSWLSLLALVGIDLSSPPLITVPLMVPIHKKEQEDTIIRSEDIIFVGGGIWWPWQNPKFAIEQVLEVLDEYDCGEIHWYGQAHPELPAHPLPNHPRLKRKGYLPLDQYRRQIRKASCALDWMESNGERELAISFRQMEYIAAGLPLITHPSAPITSLLKEVHWDTAHLQEIIQNIIKNPEMLRKKQLEMQQIQSRFSLYETTKFLLDWCKNPLRAQRIPVRILDRSLLEMRSKEWELKLMQSEMQLQIMKNDLEKKEQEIRDLQDSNQRLNSSVERLSIALERTASFKNESIQILGAQLDFQGRNKEELLQQNAILQADNVKKTAELSAMDDIRIRLEHDLENVRFELNQLKSKKRFF